MSAIERSPREKQLRRIWWVLLGVALALAGVMYYMSVNKLGTSLSYRAVLVGYVTAIAGALYLEFGPLRRARMEAVAAAKSGKKTKAPADTTKPGAGTTTQTPSAPAESKPAVPVTAAGRTRATEALTRLFRRGGDSGGGSDPGEGGAS